MTRRRRVNNEVEDDAAQFLMLFYHYISDRCDVQVGAKLRKLLETLESLIDDGKKDMLRRLEREIWKQFREDEIFCQISRNRHR